VSRVRVLVVDDSAFARKVVREVLSVSPEIEVVGIARDGLDALEKIAELSPDVITLDLVMPNLDGVGVVRALAERPNAPAVVIVSMADDDSALGVAALQGGAFDIVKKPTALATDRLYELGAELREKVLASATGVRRPPRPSVSPVMRALPITPGHAALLVVGASTGGPQAITAFVRALPAAFAIPIAIVLHMPAGYTEAFAMRLDRECAVEVMEARGGLELVPGRVIVARAGMHLVVGAMEAGGHHTVRLEATPSSTLHRPSVDVLFTSAAKQFGARVVGVVMTGMGDDGTRGARAIHDVGGRVLTEAESSCIVYGMPKSVVEAGLSDGSAPLHELVELVARNL
jgi:two-component system chemotaxis response regulator CheB